MNRKSNLPKSVRSVALDQSFIALSDSFGMVPEQLAARVLSAFVTRRPARLLVKRSRHHRAGDSLA